MKAIHTANTFHYILFKSSKWKRRCLSLFSSNSLSFKRWPVKTFTRKDVSAPTGGSGGLGSATLGRVCVSKLNKPGLILLPRVWVTLSLYPPKKVSVFSSASWKLSLCCLLPEMYCLFHGTVGQNQGNKWVWWMDEQEPGIKLISKPCFAVTLFVCSFMLSDKKHCLRGRWGHSRVKGGSQRTNETGKGDDKGADIS